MHINITVTISQEKYAYNKPKAQAEIDIDTETISPDMLSAIPVISKGLAEVAVGKYNLALKGEEIG